MIIYTATHRETGNIYVGQTTKSLQKRKEGHIYNALSGDNGYFYRAIREFGIDSFDFKVVHKCHSKEELDEQERYYIRKFRKQGIQLYNLLEGGHKDKYSSWSEDQILAYNAIKNIPITYSEIHEDTIKERREKKVMKEFRKFLVPHSKETKEGMEKYANASWNEYKTRYLGIDTI